MENKKTENREETLQALILALNNDIHIAKSKAESCTTFEHIQLFVMQVKNYEDQRKGYIKELEILLANKKLDNPTVKQLWHDTKCLVNDLRFINNIIGYNNNLWYLQNNNSYSTTGDIKVIEISDFTMQKLVFMGSIEEVKKCLANKIKEIS